MKFYLLSDNIDTQMGMRLAGIEGKVVHGEKEVAQALDEGDGLLFGGIRFDGFFSLVILMNVIEFGLVDMA